MAAAEASPSALRKRRLLNIIKGSVFLSVCQHCSNVQSEPMLVRQLCGGDIPRASLLLGNSQAVTGVIALFLNQFGGKLSDALGRRAFMLIGPIGNIIVGTIVFLNHTNLPVVLVCRVIKQMITTFSNTVIATASLTDFLSGQELARGFGQLGGMYGAALFIGPVIETQMLRLTGTPRFACA
jgi:MFS family permease